MTQDACSLLDADHVKVEQLFQRYQGSTDTGTKEQLAHQICHELTVHSQIEEEIFYPAFERATGDQSLVNESEREHDEARQLIEQIERGQVNDSIVMKLQQAVEHHVQDERQKMFPKARQTQGMDLMALGRELEQRKSELMTSHPA